MLSNITTGITGIKLRTLLHINELAREANLGPKGAQVNISVDQSTYSLPDNPERTVTEHVFEIESHGVPEELILTAADWVLRELGGRQAAQSKYSRGLRLLGRL